MDKELNQWAAALHASQLAGHVIPLAGLVIPIVIWQLKKDIIPGLDAHGRLATNWILSVLLYTLVLGLGFLFLFFMFPPIVILIIPIAAIFGIISLVFPIIAAVKASNGDLWVYPGAIPFL